MGFALQKPKNEPGEAWPAILVGLFAAFGGVLYGCAYHPTNAKI